jgi:glycosyltransferase involved in cell wall biosynthesis/tetratricopeptide (TPR) repeat protein
MQLRLPPTAEIPGRYSSAERSPITRDVLQTVLRYAPVGSRTVEVLTGGEVGAVWLSKRSIDAVGLTNSAQVLHHAELSNGILNGKARYLLGDPAEPLSDRVAVIHHQGYLEHFTTRKLRAVLAAQVASADRVIFSVPSVYYPFDPEVGDERLLPLEEWEYLLEPFEIEELRLYGGPEDGGKGHVLAVLRGQTLDPVLRTLIEDGRTSYPEGISAIVHTRNEEARLRDCLQSLKGWTDEIIVCDMESEDGTVALAAELADVVMHHPRIANFDRARNASAMRARYRWVFYLDADERVPRAMGDRMREQAMEGGFDAMLVPFRHHFAGHWMQCLYPGYTAPRLYRNGKFHFNARLHSGSHVDGVITSFPASDPNLAIVHYSFDSLSHYLTKLNSYTDGEAENMHRDGRPFQWQSAMRHFVQDLKAYYDHMGAHRDGVHGFLYSFLSAIYRFEQHGKLFERRSNAGQIQPFERAVPQSAEHLLQFMLDVVREKPLPADPELVVAPNGQEGAEVVWSGPLRDPSGYGEECRHFLLALQDAGVDAAGHPILWSRDAVELSKSDEERLEPLLHRPVKTGFVHISQNLGDRLVRHPHASINIGRTMFETDRLPESWVAACNRMDWVWVPSEFHVGTFTKAGVDADKLVVMPGCFDPGEFQPEAALPESLADLTVPGPYRFLSVFDWTLHKGWDVLLRGFLEAFKGRTDVQLVLKVWSTMGHTREDILRQAAEFVQRECGTDLSADTRIRWVFDRVSRPQLIALYKACDAFVLPSRGEGWGRPFMEAMACGKPVIGTEWSGTASFLNAETGYPVSCQVVDVPEVGWREIPTYKGHRWAEPELLSLVEQLQTVEARREESASRGAAAKSKVTRLYSREAVGKRMADEIGRVRALTHEREGDTDQTATAVLAWEGTQFAHHSLAHVNREICSRLLKSKSTELTLTPFEPDWFSPTDTPEWRDLADRIMAPTSRPVDITVRHGYPPQFSAPPHGRLVLMQPWEYGSPPALWVEGIAATVEEVWCYSDYVKRVYLSGGVPESKLQIVPLGTDTKVYNPDALPYVFTDEPGALRGLTNKFVFLYAGGSIDRKGIDILLDAYARAFTALDDVALVIKDTCADTVYRTANFRDRILQMASDPNGPMVVYLDAQLSSHRMAGVYTSADCCVQPYRGEGFCLTALEAMACGVPVVVPEGGATDDFVEETVGWRLPAKHVNYGDGNVGGWECTGDTWVLEIGVDDLARKLRAIAQNRDEASQKGTSAAKRVADAWTWDHTAAAVAKRLDALQSRPAQKTCPAARKPLPRERSGSAKPTGSAKAAQALSTKRASKTEQRSKESKPKDVGDGLRKPPTLSLCMIVRDEERVLGDCLKSIRGWMDEVIIVDTGSTDRTVEIADESGANVSHFPWCDSFSAARNVSLEQATGDWVIWMDADDTLPDECGRQMRELLFNAPDDVDGYIMQVHIPPDSGDDGFTIVDHVKVFRNRPEYRFEGRIHEQILDSIYRAGGRVERTELYVVHSGYDYSPEGQKKKRERDLRILELEVQERPNHPFVWFNVGMTHFHLKDFAKAMPALEKCLQLCRPRESIVRKVYAMLSGTCREIGSLQGARDWLERGLKLFPRDPELLFRAGILYKDLGDFPRAEQCYLTLLHGRETGHIDSLDVTMLSYKANHNLALVYHDMGRYDKEEEQYRLALQAKPDFGPSLAGLTELLGAQGRWGEVAALQQELR